MRQLVTVAPVRQTVCVDSNIENIAIRFKNSVPYVNNLPPGLYWEYAGADVIYIQGSVYYGGGGPHTIDVIGENINGCISSQITIQLMVQPDYGIAAVKVVNDINDPNNGIDNSFVENIIDKQIENEQFVNCELTFKNISTIKSVLKDKLKNIYHVRVEYPELSK